jgi:uncharacterized membrane protein HdeD (DUF308 family)
MIRIVVSLLGLEFVKKYWAAIAAVGLFWIIAGGALCIDALDGVIFFPLKFFGCLLVIDGAVTLVLTAAGQSYSGKLRNMKGIIYVIIGLLIIDPHHFSDVILALLFGSAFATEGILQTVTAHVVRFPGWRLSLWVGIAEILFAIIVFEPYPTHYAGTVPFCIGAGLMISGLNLFRMALRLRRTSAYVSVPVFLNPGSKVLNFVPKHAGQTRMRKLVVHVWTAAGTIREAVHRPVVDRYIAAVDKRGVISTGHSALEVEPDLYISHYPAMDIDRSPEQFRQTLLATCENDVPGKFQPSYAFEAQQWCESTIQVNFYDFDEERLRLFWENYKQDTTYNLTRRNCSVAVAHALETALEGALRRDGENLLSILKVFLCPELWAAGQLHKRARTMAWTPGLVLDYARSMQAVLRRPRVYAQQVNSQFAENS